MMGLQRKRTELASIMWAVLPGAMRGQNNPSRPEIAVKYRHSPRRCFGVRSTPIPLAFGCRSLVRRPSTLTDFESGGRPFESVRAR